MTTIKDGYVKVHRSILDSFLGENNYYFCIGVHLILDAAYYDGPLVKKGQVLLGTREYSKKCGVSRPTLFKFLRDAEKDGFLTRKTTSKGSIITIQNYEKYQNGRSNLDTAAVNLKTQGGQSEDPQRSISDPLLINKNKNNKSPDPTFVGPGFEERSQNEEKDAPPKKKAPCEKHSSIGARTAGYFLKRYQEVFERPYFPALGRKHYIMLTKWAKQFEGKEQSSEGFIDYFLTSENDFWDKTGRSVEIMVKAQTTHVISKSMAKKKSSESGFVFSNDGNVYLNGKLCEPEYCGEPRSRG